MSIPYGKQSINEEDVSIVTNALTNEYLTTGPLVYDFEKLLSEYIGAESFVVSSGTAALHSAFYAIGLRAGDEIITTPNTFVATQATAILLGAKPIFVDVEERTGNLDPNEIEKKITSQTKAIVAVDYAGHPCDIDQIIQIAKKHNLFFIEDAAHSLGSRYKNKRIGSQADLTTFSFFPTKNITTGEGGAVSSLNPKLLQKAKEFSRQGLIRDRDRFRLENDGPWHQEVHEFGLNYRLPDILCALGMSQLKRIEDFKSKRKKIWERYSENLGSIDGIRIPIQEKYCDPMWHLYPVRVSSEKRKEVFIKLRENGIMVQVNYVPAYWHPAFVDIGYSRGLCPVSEKFYSEEISLPIFPDLTLDKVDQISEKICEIIGTFR